MKEQNSLGKMRDLLAEKIGHGNLNLNLNEGFGSYLRSTRTVTSLTRSELAQKANLSEGDILAYEHGLLPKEGISPSHLERLANALDENLDDFLLLLRR